MNFVLEDQLDNTLNGTSVSLSTSFLSESTLLVSTPLKSALKKKCEPKVATRVDVMPTSEPCQPDQSVEFESKAVEADAMPISKDLLPDLPKEFEFKTNDFNSMQIKNHRHLPLLKKFIGKKKKKVS